MTDRDFTCSIEAAVSPSAAFELICHVADWWVADVKGEAASVGGCFHGSLWHDLDEIQGH